MPFSFRVLVVAGLIALALFVVGPQRGSVDDDLDGNPDIPVVVSGPTLADSASTSDAVSSLSGRPGIVPAMTVESKTFAGRTCRYREPSRCASDSSLSAQQLRC